MGVLSSGQLAQLRDVPPGGSGNRLQVAVELCGLTQSEIGESLRLSPAVFSDLKHGRRRRVPVPTAGKLAEFFGCDPTDLFASEYIGGEARSARRTGRSLSGSARPGLKRRGTSRRGSARVLPLCEHLEKARLELVEMLTDARLERRMTLQDVGDRLHRSRQQIEQWETSAGHMRIDSLLEWADVLGYRLCLEPVRLETR